MMTRSKKGFTLIEIIVVVGIIGILVSLLWPVIASAIQKAKQKGTMQDINSLAKAVTEYVTDNGVAPTQSGPISSASTFFSALSGFYLKVLPQNDQWGSPFEVYCGSAIQAANITGVSGTHDDDFLIRSLGRDKSTTPFTFDPLSPGSVFFTLDRMSAFDEDLVSWNGTWIHSPRSSQH
jgi:type II secretion system protein G